MSLCHVCGSEAAKKCARCHRATYCGAACAELDWEHGGHHRECFDCHQVENGLALAHEVFMDIETRAEDLGPEAVESGHEIVEALAMEHVMTEFFMDHPDLIQEALDDQELIGVEIDEEMPEDIDARAEALAWLEAHRIGGSIAHDVKSNPSENSGSNPLGLIGASLGATPDIPIGVLIAEDFSERVRRVKETDREWYDRVENRFTDAVSNAAKRAKDTIVAGGKKFGDAVKKAAVAAKKRLGEAKTAIVNKARDLKQRASQKLGDFKKKASEKISQFRQKVREKKDQFKEKFKQRRQKATERREQRRQQRKERNEQKQSEKAQRDARRKLEQNDRRKRKEQEATILREQKEAEQTLRLKQKKEQKERAEEARILDERAAAEAAAERQQRDMLRQQDEAARQAALNRSEADRQRRQAEADRTRQMLETTRRRREELAQRRSQEEVELERQRRAQEAALQAEDNNRLAELERQRLSTVRPVVYRQSIPPPPVTPTIAPPPLVPSSSFSTGTPPPPPLIDPVLVKGERDLDLFERNLEALEKKELSKAKADPAIVKALDDAIRSMNQAKLDVQTLEQLQADQRAAMATASQLRYW